MTLPRLIFIFSADLNLRQSDYVWSTELIHLQVSECLTPKLFLTHPPGLATSCFAWNCLLDCLTPTCHLFFSLDGTSSRKISLTYLLASESGTTSVLPRHPVPCSICNFFFNWLYLPLDCKPHENTN